MKKLVILAGLMAVALVLGVAGTAVHTDKAQAKPEDVLAFSPQVCISLLTVLDDDLDWNEDTVIDANDATARRTACATGLTTPGNLGLVAQALGADIIAASGAAETIAQCNDGVDDDADTVADDGCADDYNDPALWQDLNDLSGSQLGDYSTGVQGALWVLSFVTNDGALTLEADEGIWVSSTTSNTDCASIIDADCDNDGVKGDKIVVDKLLGNSVADRGDSELVATQGGVDVVYDYVVVGEPDSIALALLSDEIVQEDAATCADDPHLTPLDSSVFTDGAAEPEKNGLLAVVTDDDDVELAGIYVNWSSDDTDVADLNLPTSITWALESGTMAANLFCGDETGTATITAEISGGADDDEVDVTVIGVPDAMTLSASPASIACDGVTSSTVSAALVDSEGNQVVDGTDVRFEVVALGIADPIQATTAGGAATSTITPLSGVSAGVVVLVTVLDAEGDVSLEGNIRIDCAEPVPVAPPPVAPVVPEVVPPGTGDGGCLP